MGFWETLRNLNYYLAEVVEVSRCLGKRKKTVGVVFGDAVLGWNVKAGAQPAIEWKDLIMGELLK